MQKEEQQRSLRVVYGNDLDLLAAELGLSFFSSSAAFEKRIVVVPDLCMKHFLYSKWECMFGIAAGVQVLPFSQAVVEIVDSLLLSASFYKKRIPIFAEMTLAIEEQLSLLEEEFSSLREYLDQRPKRISSFSDELARCFVRYGLYGVQFLEKWLTHQGWQQTLWKRLFSSDSPWTYPLEFLQHTKNIASIYRGKIALFGFSYVPPAHLCFFSAFKAELYQLSPCALFWGDFASDKQRVSARRKGGSQELAASMEQGHPLLRNWGKLGREYLRSLDAFLLDEREVYSEEFPNTLLGDIKASLLQLEQSSFQRDPSVQLHSATSVLREVEILHDRLQTLMQEHVSKGDPICPRDIVIATHDISGYAPYISMVFSEGPLPYSIEGMPLVHLSECVQGFLRLLSLPKEGYRLEFFLELFRGSSFLEKTGFSVEEVTQLFRWFREAEIKRDLRGHSNSWEAGIDRLLYGLAMIPAEETLLQAWPVASIPQSEIDLFNRFLSFFCELKNDLALFAIPKTASQWLSLFLKMAEHYFVIVWDREPFFQELKMLAVSCMHFKEKKWDFESIQRLLKHLSQKSSGSISSRSANHLVFVPLSLGVIKAARIVWCLGMDEASFPTAREHSSLCEMERLRSTDYYPLKADEDRYVFLELFLKAKDYLFFSYQRIHPEDGKHQGPSVLIEELSHYLQLNILKIDHPFLSLPPLEKTLPPFFSHQPFEASVPEELFIDIRQLKKLARHPLQFYFNETLKIFLREEEDKEEAEFLVSHLRKSLLRKEALHLPLSTLVRQIGAKGKLPRGLFQEAAVEELQEEIEAFFKELQTFGVQQEEIYSVRFVANFCGEAYCRPPLTLQLSNGSVVHIVGELENVTPQGLLAHAEADMKSLVKVWPLYLIYRCLDPQHRFLLLTKKGVRLEIPLADPHVALTAYLEYFLLAMQSPSPFMPQWAKALLQGKDVAAEMLKETQDIYLNYLKRRGCSFPLSSWGSILKKTFNELEGV